MNEPNLYENNNANLNSNANINNQNNNNDNINANNLNKNNDIFVTRIEFNQFRKEISDLVMPSGRAGL